MCNNLSYLNLNFINKYYCQKSKNIQQTDTLSAIKINKIYKPYFIFSLLIELTTRVNNPFKASISRNQSNLL